MGDMKTFWWFGLVVASFTNEVTLLGGYTTPICIQANKVNSALYPLFVAKSSNSFNWLK